MMLTRPAAVFAVVIVLAGGTIATASATSGSDPVTLCAHANASGTVSVPGGSGCGANETPFTVAAGDALDMLAGQLSALEAENTAQADALAALENRISDLETANATQTDAVAALDNRVAANEASNQAQDADIAGIQRQLADLLTGELTQTATHFDGYTRHLLDGTDLRPGSPVYRHYVVDGGVHRNTVATVGELGQIIPNDVTSACSQSNVYFTTETVTGLIAKTDTTKPDGPTC